MIPPAPADINAVPRGKRLPLFKDTRTEQGLEETDGLTLIDRDVTLDQRETEIGRAHV